MRQVDGGVLASYSFSKIIEIVDVVLGCDILEGDRFFEGYDNSLDEEHLLLGKACLQIIKRLL